MNERCSERAVKIPASVLNGLDVAAKAARPLETGGILIGWREGDCVIVRDWIQICASDPRPSRFVIDAAEATEALGRHLRARQEPFEGYVGTWHSHPSLTPPSAVDIKTYRASASATQAPLAFVVLATNGVISTAYITWAGDNRKRVNLITQEPVSVGRISYEPGR